MNARFRGGFLHVLHFIPGIRRCCCVRKCARGRNSSIGAGLVLTGEMVNGIETGGLTRKSRIYIRCPFIKTSTLNIYMIFFVFIHCI